MALFMDVHTLPGPVGLADAARAHAADMQTQGRYGVTYLRYWVDPADGKIFCLVEARTPRPRPASTRRRTDSSRMRSSR
jgi:hypothetical protein